MKRITLVAALAASLHAGAAGAATRPAVEAKHGMVVSAQRLASQAGVDILKMGGNAIDAAVAVGYAQAVVNPCCGNIGGGGFMTIHLADGRETFINFREQAPAKASADMYLDADGNVIRDASLHGYLAVGVPGTVLGLDTAWKQYGKLTRAQVMAPAIRLAREGFVLTRADTDILDTQAARFHLDPGMARVFLRQGGTPLQPGDRLRQPDLARTLAAIAARGPDAFYHGALPQAVERAARAGNGVISAADFAGYRITQDQPLNCSYRGYDFVAAPPPSSGGVTLCQILNVLEGYDLKTTGPQSAATIHVMVEAMRHAYRDRNATLGDPAFVDNPVAHLMDKAYAAEIRARIGARATPSSELPPLPPAQQRERPETTHYSVVDQDGNAVSTTYTINGRFGALVMAPGTGVVLNNEMDDFTVKEGTQNLFGLVQGVANAIAPGKRPLSSMAPTLVKKDGKVYMVLGSPGGSRIITITLQTALNVIDFGMAPQEAVDAPRIHHQWLPDAVAYERRGVSPDTLRLLKDMGYDMREQSGWGAAELILVAPPVTAAPGSSSPTSSGSDSAVSGKVRPGFLYGAHDDRQPAGEAIGY
ncbi:gamma-glutamyltransferase [Duganella violaceipulchra]|uniref:Glutathione hydrolase proenzyme n=1 Tax=Duganella violaceipulchra TaxID=2849652 RepID=A0AA41L4E8_9BURK|nr:gamma-glutamyltransferase [Duganella violaceicalia]MBV6320892.1 gamma-glutamyltransferase [Duganella violaceicalia]MCP2008397.1 gamma-glutamyltranspeptidase/glutathione hydrolase [Duganella violaceicalia]